MQYVIPIANSIIINKFHEESAKLFQAAVEILAEAIIVVVVEMHHPTEYFLKILF